MEKRNELSNISFHFIFQTQTCSVVIIKETPLICPQLAIVHVESAKPNTDTNTIVEAKRSGGISMFGKFDKAEGHFFVAFNLIFLRIYLNERLFWYTA